MQEESCWDVEMRGDGEVWMCLVQGVTIGIGVVYPLYQDTIILQHNHNILNGHVGHIFLQNGHASQGNVSP